MPKGNAAEIVDLALTKPHLFVHAGDLPATAEAVRDLLAASGKFFDRGVPVRIVKPADGSLPSATPLDKAQRCYRSPSALSAGEDRSQTRSHRSDFAGSRRTDVSRHDRRVGVAVAHWSQHRAASVYGWLHTCCRRLRPHNSLMVLLRSKAVVARTPIARRRGHGTAAAPPDVSYFSLCRRAAALGFLSPGRCSRHH